MNQLLDLGRRLFPLSFLMYVGLHFGKPDTGADFVPDWLPFPYFWNYFTALCIIAFIISALTARYDKLAYTLMALYVLLMGLLVHLPRALGMNDELMLADIAGQELEMVNFFRNLMVMSALLGFARYVARDVRIIG